MTENFFYIVSHPTGHIVPLASHPNNESAQREAERLAKANKGQRLYVAKVISVSHVSPQVITTKIDEPGECPF